MGLTQDWSWINPTRTRSQGLSCACSCSAICLDWVNSPARVLDPPLEGRGVERGRPQKSYKRNSQNRISAVSVHTINQTVLGAMTHLDYAPAGRQRGCSHKLMERRNSLNR